MKEVEYDVALHFDGIGWKTYEVNAGCISVAILTAIKEARDKKSRGYMEQIDIIRVFKHGTDKLLKEY